MPGREERLARIARIAVDLEASTGLPAQLTVAQWAVESEWGKTPVGQANYFGMKRAKRHTKFCVQDTHEVVNGKVVPDCSQFADYNSLEESANDYANLVTTNGYYAKPWDKFRKDGNLGGLIHGVTSLYATSQYGSLAQQIAHQSNVTSAIEKARTLPNK